VNFDPAVCHICPAVWWSNIVNLPHTLQYGLCIKIPLDGSGTKSDENFGFALPPPLSLETYTILYLILHLCLHDNCLQGGEGEDLGRLKKF